MLWSDALTAIPMEMCICTILKTGSGNWHRGSNLWSTTRADQISNFAHSAITEMIRSHQLIWKTLTWKKEAQVSTMPITQACMEYTRAL
eukprot:5853103-Amphidinium_carterae.1